ncbi:MAG TPA: hypothetical protein VGJ57_11025 [Nitrospirales bacterium]|jgi:hypothetical protein
MKKILLVSVALLMLALLRPASPVLAASSDDIARDRQEFQRLELKIKDTVAMMKQASLAGDEKRVNELGKTANALAYEQMEVVKRQRARAQVRPQQPERHDKVKSLR